jgi:hypothetical protein
MKCPVSVITQGNRGSVQGLCAAVWLVTTVFLCLPATTEAQPLLVDFGSSAGGNTFGMSGWTSLIKSGAVDYTADGPGGLVADASVDEYADYQGVRGSSRAFTTAERIVVTWYNRSDETIRFSARISFTDDDQPDGETSSGRWYTMRGEANYRETWTEIGPHETARTMFAIRGGGVHKTDSAYALVNINLAIEWGSSDRKQYLVCDRIQLFDDADITPPAAPSGVQATDISDSKIRIAWTAPADDVGVYDYLIYLDGEVEGYSRENSHTCVFLEPDTEYRLAVTARDVMQNESARSWEVAVRTAPYAGGKTLVGPEGVQYLGAFRLPEQFTWGGEAIAYRADGDGGPTGGGSTDGFPGSLFVTNVNQFEQGLVGEIGIPAPMAPPAGSIDALPTASMLMAPVNIRPAEINAWDFVDIWRTGLQYRADEQRLYSAWSVHYTVTGDKHASISCAPAASLSAGPHFGPWLLGAAGVPPLDAHQSDYLFTVPDSWAASNTGGRSLVVGRCRDGGLSGLGPTLYAFAPVGANPPATGTSLGLTTLLQYGSVEGTDNYHYPDAIDGYKHSDEWRDACWLASTTQSAVAVIGRKAHGDNWYGYHGEHMPHDWIIADVPYYAFDDTDPDGKGWRAHRLSPMMIFYDPAALADVAAGRIGTHEPQPYAALRLDPGLFFSPACEIRSAAFDAADRLLYITEFVRDPVGDLVMHVFRVNDVATGTEETASAIPVSPWIRCRPNPFDAAAEISFGVPYACEAALRVHDLLGRVVAVLAEGRMQAGTHVADFNPRRLGLSAGIYFAVLNAGGTAYSAMMIFTK